MNVPGRNEAVASETDFAVPVTVAMRTAGGNRSARRSAS
jgi:hypothetical protein